jgi:hypothetical protein
MRGRRQQSPGMSARSRWTAGALGLALAAGATSLALVPAGSANAAQKPTPSYTAGHDNATFTATGVLDGNCLVSTGGTSIYIKPGDKIKFGSSLVGISVSNAVAGKTLGGLLNGLLQPSQVAGLDVTAKIDAGKSTAKTITVAGGKTTVVGGLAKGNHKITWTATGLALLPALNLPPVALSSDDLKSGAKLSWTGVIHVTTGAPQCTVTVATPKVGVSVGPIKVTVPPIKVTVPGVKLPTSLPSLPNLLPSKSGSAPSTGATKPTTGKSTYKYTPPALTVPDEVVPHGQGNAVYSGGGVTTGGGSDTTGLTDGTPSTTTSTAPNGTVKTSAAQVTQDSTGKHKTIDLASSTDSHSGQLPVLLAILAVIALAMVAGTYARLYLLGRKK